MTRFDYIPFDHIAETKSLGSKNLCKELEEFIEKNLKPTRERACAITKLEECFMWIGKAIKVDQLERQEPRIEPVLGRV